MELQEQLIARKSSMPIVFITGHGDVPMAVSTIKKKLIEQLVQKTKQREDNFGAMSVGDIVEAEGSKFEVVNVGSSYLTVINESGQLVKKWLHECLVIGKSKNNKIQIVENQISYKGYVSKHLTEAMVSQVSEKRNFNRFMMISFLTRYDMMMEESDINKQKSLAEQVIGYSEKLGLRIDENINNIDDKMIFEAAQGHIKYSAPIKSI